MFNDDIHTTLLIAHMRALYSNKLAHSNKQMADSQVVYTL